jgi:hypothetical protein
MATKKAKKEKPKPPIRFFAGGELFYSGEYDSDTGKVTTTYHNKELQDSLEPIWSKRLTEAARTIIAENPNNGLLDV